MVSLFDYIIMAFPLFNIRNWLYIIYCAILYILLDCKCNETVMHGYGMCRKRSSRLGGNFLCAVDDDSNCTDVVQEPGSGIYVSVEACKNINLGEMLGFLSFLLSTSLMARNTLSIYRYNIIIQMMSLGVVANIAARKCT